MNIFKHKWILFLVLSIAILLILLMTKFVIFEHKTSTPSLTNTVLKIQLPAPVFHSNTSIEAALKQRRSIREYKDEPISLQHVSQLLWAAQGITSKEGFRTAPSAGALYPLEIYIVSGKISNLPSGIYHYLPSEHSLVAIAGGDQRNELAKIAFKQNSVKNAAIDIVITAAYIKTVNKYGARGERYIAMEAGHAAENVCLQAVSLQLGTVTIGAFDDDMLKKFLNTTNEDPLYILPIGKI